MEHLLQLYQQLKDQEDLINSLAGFSGIRATLDNMMVKRAKLIRRIQNYQMMRALGRD